eukprot:TRINITY_DN4981_c0_g1_i1.p1 TRINITY_DN4981_c0_g1~~TRINITY_DN4981_c0_g1_i1.p1  ORF type:complete len:210 (+),score=34.47 TRINITY_DN4981_c0_g1_i1:26-655(+)
MANEMRMIAALEQDKSEKEHGVLKLIQVGPIPYFIPEMDWTRRLVDVEKYDTRNCLDLAKFLDKPFPPKILRQAEQAARKHVRNLGKKQDLQKYLQLFHLVPPHVDPLHLPAKQIRAGLNESVHLREKIRRRTPKHRRDINHRVVIAYLKHCALVFHQLVQQQDQQQDQQRKIYDNDECSYDTNNSNSASAADSDGWITIGKTHTRRHH